MIKNRLKIEKLVLENPFYEKYDKNKRKKSQMIAFEIILFGIFSSIHN